MRRLAFAFILLVSLTAVSQTVPIPFIDQPLSPTSALPGSTGFTLTVHGANFAPSAVLEWNGKQRRTVVVSSALLQATIDTADLTKAGTAFVTVVNLGSNSQTSNTGLFTIRKPAPAVAFTPDPNFSPDSAISSVVGDFNSDGRPDVVTSAPPQQGSGSVITAYLGEGQGKFQPGIQTVLARNQPGRLFAGDFNGDRKLDLAMVIPQPVFSRLIILLGNGSGKFRLASIADFRRGSAYAVADMNGDGVLDLLFKTNHGAEILFGKGDGTFTEGTPIDGQSPMWAVPGDFNEDGRLDLAILDNTSKGTRVAVALNQGNGDFSKPVRYPLPVNSRIVTADINGDGHLDIVSDTLAILLGKGNGKFAQGEGSVYSGGGIPVIADFNGDGKLDLLFLSDPFSLMLGNGDGTFQAASAAGSGGLGDFGGITDFNNDGHLDLAGNGGANGSGGVFWQISAGLYPAMLSYGPQRIGTSSPPQTANLYNAGSTPLNLTSIGIGGTDSDDFTQTNNCPNSIPVGSGCKIQVVFTPTAAGTRQASLNVVYAGFGSPLSVALSGQGEVNTSVSLTPSSLPFPKQLLDTTSMPQAATLTNTGSNDVSINNINTTGSPFAQANNCPSTLPVGKSCQIQVTFTPTQNGPATGTLSVGDNAPDSPQTVALSGTGTSVAFKPIGANFGDQKVGTKSAPVPVTFTNKGTVALSISQIAFGGTNPGDFSQTNDCPTSLPAGNGCTIQVTFKPTQKGARAAALQVSDDANPSPQQADFEGTGT